MASHSDSPPTLESTTITTVLLDLDGVVQRPRDFVGQARTLLAGKASVRDLLDAERPALSGNGDLHADLARFIERYQVPVTVADLIRLWRDIEVDPEVLQLCDQLRERGVRVHVASNQQPMRKEFITNAFGYADHFDEQFYSCDLRVAKPDPAFFHAIIDRLQLTPEHTLFIDDLEENVTAARTTGLVAQWHNSELGATGIRHLLSAHQLLAD